MNFLVDAQLPYRLSEFLNQNGHNSIHILDLQKGNSATDKELNDISIQEKRILIKKDGDFVNSLILYNLPYKLLHITTGNVTNNDLLDIFQKNLSLIVSQFKEHFYVELDQFNLIPHF